MATLNISAQTMDDNEKFDRLTEILSNAGVKGLDFFQLRNFKNYGRGLSSLLSRQPGETLFCIPLQFVFTDYNIENHPKLSAIWKKYPKLLAAFEQNSNSQNAVYPFLLLFFYELLHPSTEFNRLWFSMFPRNLNSHTIAWTDKELKSCGNLCPIRRDTVEIQVWIKKTFKILQPIIAEFEEDIFGQIGVSQFDESMVEFLCMTCRNRGVMLPICEGKNEEKNGKLYHCFVPLGDFGNHKFGSKSSLALEYQNKRRHLHDENINLFVKSHPQLMTKKFFEFNSSDNVIIVRCQEQILSGGQICYEYTAAPNWELLENFGFAVPFNPFDRVIVNVSFENDDLKRLSKELQILNKMGISSFIQRSDQKNKYSMAVALTLSDAMPQILLSANRIKLLSDDQLSQLSVKQIAFMDRVILKNENNKIKEDMVNALKILELNVLRSLQASIDILYSGYAKDSLIDEKDCKHSEVHIVYQSIKRILQKSKQILEGKIKDLV